MLIRKHLLFITEKEPNLIQHPSGYLKQALYYSQKPKKKYTKLLTDEEYMQPEGLVFKPINTISYSIEDEILNKIESENKFNSIYEIIDTYIEDNNLDEEESSELINYIIDCLEIGNHYKKYLYNINTKKIKDCFCECFGSIEIALRKEIHCEK